MLIVKKCIDADPLALTVHAGYFASTRALHTAHLRKITHMHQCVLGRTAGSLSSLSKQLCSCDSYQEATRLTKGKKNEELDFSPEKDMN